MLLLLVALHVGSADASAGWIVHGRNRAGTRQAQHVLRPTSTEQHLAAGLSGFARPCLALRGGCSSADGSVSEGGGKGGGEAARESDSSGGATAAAAAAAGGLDEDLYSRQLYVMGKTAMAKMGKADVLISGMRCVCLASCMLTYRGWVGGWVGGWNMGCHVAYISCWTCAASCLQFSVSVVCACFRSTRSLCTATRGRLPAWRCL